MDASPDPDEEADCEPLAIQDTRPNMFLGIPYDLAIIFGAAFFAIDTQLHSMVWGFSAVPFWIGAAVLVRRDVNGFRVAWVRWRIGMFSMMDAHRWDGWSVSPWPLKPGQTYRGDDDAV
jgi:type IV secretory pathway VirB3-like protein